MSRIVASAGVALLGVAADGLGACDSHCLIPFVKILSASAGAEATSMMRPQIAMTAIMAKPKMQPPKGGGGCGMG
jgi:hypothetical protein